MSSLLALGVGVFGAALLCWGISLWTGEVSWTDRLWAILPPIYVGYFWYTTGFSDARLWWMFALTTAWGLRLTYNLWRKGGFRPGEEDYRWALVRARLTPAQFQWFNLLFIAGYQHLLLGLLALPAWQASKHHGAPLGAFDALAMVAFTVFLFFEAAADQQQWDFHQYKAAKQARGETVSPPFNTRGLWSISRHPNFFFEQAQWWTLYLFSVGSGAGWLNVSIIGPVLLTLLFDGSTRFTEKHSASKYPAYAEYQRTTPRWWPWPRPRA